MSRRLIFTAAVLAAVLGPRFLRAASPEGFASLFAVGSIPRYLYQGN